MDPMLGDVVTGAPVNELRYRRFFMAVPNEVDMVTYRQTGVAPRF